MGKCPGCGQDKALGLLSETNQKAPIISSALGHFTWRAMDMCDRPPFDWTKQLGYLPALQVTGPSGQEDGWDERWTKQGEEMPNLYLRLNISTDLKTAFSRKIQQRSICQADTCDENHLYLLEKTLSDMRLKNDYLCGLKVDVLFIKHL